LTCLRHSGIGHAFLGEAFFRGAVKLLRRSPILAALFSETVQSRAMQVFSGCLNRAAVIGHRSTGSQNVARTIVIVLIFVLPIDEYFTSTMTTLSTKTRRIGERSQLAIKPILTATDPLLLYP
jgi:hypothetical protein